MKKKAFRGRRFCSILLHRYRGGSRKKERIKMDEKEILREKERYTFEDLTAITRILRSEGGCPWDRKQTHDSLIPCLSEEAGEVIGAIENRDMENLCEELGDLLFQVMIHSRIAQEEGVFTVDDVIGGVCRKMIRRHPHVFGDEKVASAEEGVQLWERIKSVEKRKKP